MNFEKSITLIHWKVASLNDEAPSVFDYFAEIILPEKANSRTLEDDKMRT